MPSFSDIVNAPQLAELVQKSTLERSFGDALFPELLIRGVNVDADEAVLRGRLAELREQDRKARWASARALYHELGLYRFQGRLRRRG